MSRERQVAFGATRGGQSGDSRRSAAGLVTSVDALREQVDQLQCDVNRLELENRRLRADDVEANTRVFEQPSVTGSRSQADEAEGRADRGAEAARRVDLAERQAAEAMRQVAEAERRVAEAERRAAEAESRAQDCESQADARWLQRLEEAEGRHSRELDAIVRDRDLDRYRSVEEERGKWEARETRLVSQLNGVEKLLAELQAPVTTTSALESRLEALSKELEKSQGEALCLRSGCEIQQRENEELRAELERLRFLAGGLVGEVPTCGVSGGDPGVAAPMSAPRATVSEPLPMPVTTASTASTALVGTAGVPVAVAPVITVSGPPTSVSHVAVTLPAPTAGVTSPVPVASAGGPVTTPVPMTLTTAGMTVPTLLNPLVSQLPPISRFSGDEQSGDESFPDWLEQFEAVAALAGWDDPTKLVNLTTRLRGSAYSFYRSCAPEQRSSYGRLTEQLTTRFTPVQIQAVQSQLFHSRHQKARETVDEYAQDLRKLYARAYMRLSRGGPEAEAMGQSVLANQFVSGLKPELRAKVVGTDGTLDQLLVKARFEEAKSRELAAVFPSAQKKPGNTAPLVPPAPSGSSSKDPVKPPQSAAGGPKTDRKCFNCGLGGHLAASCPYPKPSRRDKEARGQGPNSVATVMSGSEAEQEIVQDRVVEL